jgi:ribosomal protein S19
MVGHKFGEFSYPRSRYISKKKKEKKKWTKNKKTFLKKV